MNFQYSFNLMCSVMGSLLTRGNGRVKAAKLYPMMYACDRRKVLKYASSMSTCSYKYVGDYLVYPTQVADLVLNSDQGNIQHRVFNSRFKYHVEIETWELLPTTDTHWIHNHLSQYETELLNLMYEEFNPIPLKELETGDGLAEYFPELATMPDEVDFIRILRVGGMCRNEIAEVRGFWEHQIWMHSFLKDHS